MTELRRTADRMDADFYVLRSTLDTTTERLMVAIDDLVQSLDPDVVRVTWPHQKTVGYGVGPRKLSEHYSYLTCHAAHVNLGFNHGVVLPDPLALLQGTGRSYRHITVRQIEDLLHPGVTDLLVAARAQRVAALDRSGH